MSKKKKFNYNIRCPHHIYFVQFKSSHKITNYDKRKYGNTTIGFKFKTNKFLIYS